MSCKKRIKLHYVFAKYHKSQSEKYFWNILRWFCKLWVWANNNLNCIYFREKFCRYFLRCENERMRYASRPLQNFKRRNFQSIFAQYFGGILRAVSSKWAKIRYKTYPANFGKLSQNNPKDKAKSIFIKYFK